MSEVIANLKEFASNAKAWPFAEARALASRMEKLGGKDEVLFETGYGPSGLPHIGTFGEVVRTTMVRHAYETLTGQKTRLVCFSDDMDGFRKIPDNVPNHDMLKAYLNMPLTKVADPFGTAPSFGEHNNLRLQAFLDSFGFSYEFMSSTECYQAGMFDDALLCVLDKYDAIMDIMPPTLGVERQATYSPFFPICPDTGKVLQAKVVSHDPGAGTITYVDPDSGAEREVSVTGGQCKLQWKCDWAMRWYALGVDYEMCGKDLTESVDLASKICKAIGKRSPVNLIYEMFLDEKGEKISKSKGNGITIDQWLSYASPESLSLYMYQNPKRAKKLYKEIVSKAVDDYLDFIEKAKNQDELHRLH